MRLRWALIPVLYFVEQGLPVSVAAPALSSPVSAAASGLSL